MSTGNRVSVVGLGNLGQTLAVCLAWRGFNVTGVDVNDGVIASLERGVATIVEPRVQQMLSESLDRFHATRDHRRAIADSDVTFVLVATPSADDGSFSVAFAEAALRDLGCALRESGKRDHLFVVGSTVSPGSMTHLVSVLEDASGQRVADGLNVCYCPELVALGTAAYDFLNPDAVVIGESCPAAGERAAAVYRRLCVNDPPHLHMGIPDAEVAKLALNCFLSLKISFANEVSRLCEALPNVDASAVMTLLERDRRIGKGYLLGGLPFGGPCFPRDTVAYLEVSRRVGDPAHLMNAAQAVNRSQLDHLLDLVRGELSFQGTNAATILGVAYKEDSSLLTGSSGVALAEALINSGVEVTIFDPLAMPAARLRFGEDVIHAESLEEALRAASVVVVLTRVPEFAKIDRQLLPRRPVSIVDCWRMLSPQALGSDCRLLVLGRSAGGGTSAPVRRESVG